MACYRPETVSRDNVGHDDNQARAATTMASTPVSRVGRATRAKIGEWLVGMFWAIRPTCLAFFTDLTGRPRLSFLHHHFGTVVLHVPRTTNEAVCDRNMLGATPVPLVRSTRREDPSRARERTSDLAPG